MKALHYSFLTGVCFIDPRVWSFAFYTFSGATGKTAVKETIANAIYFRHLVVRVGIDYPCIPRHYFQVCHWICNT